MPEQVVLFLFSLPAPTVLLRRLLSPESVTVIWKIVWSLAVLLTAGLGWLLLFRLSFALFNPGRTAGRVLFCLAMAISGAAAVAVGFLLAPLLLGRVT